MYDRPSSINTTVHVQAVSSCNLTLYFCRDEMLHVPSRRKQTCRVAETRKEDHRKRGCISAAMKGRHLKCRCFWAVTHWLSCSFIAGNSISLVTRLRINNPDRRGTTTKRYPGWNEKRERNMFEVVQVWRCILWCTEAFRGTGSRSIHPGICRVIQRLPFPPPNANVSLCKSS